MSLIIGKGAEDCLPELSRVLQRRTKNRWQELNHVELSSYFPAMCLHCLNDIYCPDFLKRDNPKKDGWVVVDKYYLAGMSDLFHKNRGYFFDILIGSDDDWEIFQDIEGVRSDYAKKVNDAVLEIRRMSNFFNSIFDDLVVEIVPLKQKRARGLSSDILRGSIFLGVPDEYPKVLLMMDIVHELGHQAITTLNSADRIFECDYNTPVYSEIRHAERPAMQSLHAAAAIAYMLHLILDMGCSEQKHPDCPDCLSPTLKRAVRSLRERCQFTRIGNVLLDEFEALADKSLLA